MGSIDIGKALADSGKVKLAVKPSLVGDSANKPHPSLFSASQVDVQIITTYYIIIKYNGDNPSL